MVRRLIIKGLGTSLIQVLLYVLLITLCSTIANYFDRPSFKGSDWGITIILSIIFFSVTVSILNILTALVNRNWFVWTTLVIATINYIYVFGGFDNLNNRTVFFLTIGLTCLFVKPLVDKVLEKLSAKHNT